MAACGDTDQVLVLPPAPAEGQVEVPVSPGAQTTDSPSQPGDMPAAPSEEGLPAAVEPLPAGENFATSLRPGLGEAELCGALQQDRTLQNEIALNRFLLLGSPARIEATVGEPIASEDGFNFAAPMRVERVWFGAGFVEGTQTYVALDAQQAEAFAPGRYLMGMSAPFPSHDLATGSARWFSSTLIPIAEREPYADLFDYELQAPARVGVVEVAQHDSYYVTLRVVESLSGDLPGELTDFWDTQTSDVEFPPVGSTRYLATFQNVFYHEQAQRYFGSLTDFRPDDEAARAAVTQGLAAPVRSYDAAALLGENEDLRRAYTVRRAPAVIATRIDGAAYECCTGAGGIYFSHAVTHDFRASLGAQRLLLGGHGYFSEERCGERYLLALDAAAALPYREPQGGLGCGDPLSWPSSVDAYVPTAEVRVQVPDSALARAKFADWLQAPDPVYRLRSESEPAEPAALNEHALWSQPPSLEQMLVRSTLILISVAAVSTRGDVTDVVLETGFSAAPSSPRQRVRLTARCIDPRLLRVGSTWFAPLVWDELGGHPLADAGPFLIPGWLLPAHQRLWAVGETFRSMLQNRR